MSISLEEAYAGALKTVGFDRMVACPSCSGTGEDMSQKERQCPSCKGAGQIIKGVMACGICAGKGKIRPMCQSCSVAGHAVSRKRVNITIPQRMPSGSVLRVRDAGNVPAAGGAGDLYVHVSYPNRQDGVVMGVDGSMSK